MSTEIDKFPVVLVIDDEKAIRAAIGMCLQDSGYLVLEAEDGEEGLTVFHREKPDLVIVDFFMPKMDGLQVLSIIREESPDTPVIVVSGTGNVADVVEALRLGAWNFLLKPGLNMTVLTYAVGRALERARLIKENRNYQERLERRVAERTAELNRHKWRLEELVEERTAKLQETNDALNESLEDLKRTQKQLVESEKMASLGGLVAGVAHEINTPIGIGVTAASHLQEKVEMFSKMYASEEASHDDLQEFLAVVEQGTAMILGNIRRASSLIQGFKQVAVDQSTEQSRLFNVKEYLQEIFHSLHPRLKKTPHVYDIKCPDDLKIHSYPGALSQVVTNLIMNSLIHGFEGVEKGTITVEVFSTGESCEIVYNDDGVGMGEESLKNVFEPFYTSRRGKGGTGLGMHLAFNIVTQTMGGDISCESHTGLGTTFRLIIPNIKGADHE